MFTFGRLVGIAPFTAQTTTSLKFSPKYAVYSVVFCLILSSITLFGLVSDLLVDKSETVRMINTFTTCISFGDILFMELLIVVQTINVIAKRDCYVKIATYMGKIDTYLNTKPLNRPPKKVYVLLLLAALLFTWDNLSWYFTKRDSTPALSILKYVPFMCSNFVAIVFAAQYWLIVKGVQKRLAQIREQLVICKTTLLHFEEGAKTRYTVDVHIRKILLAYQNVFEVVCCINQMYGVPLLATFVNIIAHEVLIPYYLVYELMSSSRMHFVVTCAVWILCYTFLLCCLVWAPSDSEEEVLLISSLVSQILSMDLTNYQRKQTEIFSTTLLHQRIKFTAHGMFAINKRVITSMVGAITTYLVILSQFQSSNNASDK